MTEKIPFDSEYQLHTLTQKHLKELFDLEFVASEIQKDGSRMDNLAFDEKKNAFVIIEYKNELNMNVINQVKEYRETLIANNEEYAHRVNNSGEINFDNTRVIIIGPEFTQKQVEESEKLDFQAEMYVISLFKKDDKNGYVIYESTDGNFKKQLDIDLDSIKLTKDTLLNDKSEDVIELYNDFEEKLLYKFDDLDLKYLVDAVSIKSQNKYICLVNVKKKIKIIFYTKKLEDEKNQTRDISNITTGGKLADYELTLNRENIDYAINLIKQVYDQKVLK
jgi:predicted transport protein